MTRWTTEIDEGDVILLRTANFALRIGNADLSHLLAAEHNSDVGLISQASSWIKTTMKKLLPIIIAAAVSGTVATSVLFSALSTGCQSYPWPSGQPSLTTDATNQVILRAEQTAESARLTFNELVTLERNNEAGLKAINPQIHVYSNKLRAHGLDWVESLRESTRTFKQNRTPENQSNITTWIATLTDAIAQSQRYITQIQKGP